MDAGQADWARADQDRPGPALRSVSDPSGCKWCVYGSQLRLAQHVLWYCTSCTAQALECIPSTRSHDGKGQPGTWAGKSSLPVEAVGGVRGARGLISSRAHKRPRCILPLPLE